MVGDERAEEVVDDTLVALVGRQLKGALQRTKRWTAFWPGCLRLGCYSTTD